MAWCDGVMVRRRDAGCWNGVMVLWGIGGAVQWCDARRRYVDTSHLRAQLTLKLTSSRGGIVRRGERMGAATEQKIGVGTVSVADCAGTFRFGIEEEYFLVDAETKTIAANVPEALFAAAKASTLGRGKCEFLQQQLEVATEPHVDMVRARAELQQLRQTLAAIAAPHGLAIVAAGTHPTAVWTEARQTKAKRYDAVMHDLQMIGKRNMLCGLHVHVELPDPDARVDVMTRMLPYLPIFIALATSSPFWRSRRTGLLGYRLAAYDELPRTGVPELFRTRKEFETYVDTLVRGGVMPDASYIWWAMRPSAAHPTLELRAPDCCTRLEDTLAIAALYRTLARRVFLNPWINADLTAVSRAVVVENKWRAQRYGIHGTSSMRRAHARCRLRAGSTR